MLWLGMLMLALLFLAMAGAVESGRTGQLDNRVTLFFISIRRAWLTRFFRFITSLGTGPIVTGFCLLSFFFLNYGNLPVRLFLGAASSGAFNWCLKTFYKRPRPDKQFWLVTEIDSSFPSSHSMVAGTLAGILILNSSSFPAPLALACLSLAPFFMLLIGLSRIYLGVHYLSDVIAGWTAGLFLALLWTVLASVLPFI